eukprot:4660695-Amphidinium_carterae.1
MPDGEVLANGRVISFPLSNTLVMERPGSTTLITVKPLMAFGTEVREAQFQNRPHRGPLDH